MSHFELIKTQKSHNISTRKSHLSWQQQCTALPASTQTSETEVIGLTAYFKAARKCAKLISSPIFLKGGRHYCANISLALPGNLLIFLLPTLVSPAWLISRLHPFFPPFPAE